MPVKRAIFFALALFCSAVLADGQAPQPSNHPSYAGSASCANCHSDEYQAWQGSHHDRAMQHASDTTVLGDFNNSVFSHYAGSYRFYRENDHFKVEFTPVENTAPSEHFTVLYTFGVEPLQQYLVPFTGGRLQALPIAWDTLQQQWFDVQGDLQPQPHERIHWQQGGLNWNSMCADCHSTGLEKNYQPQTDSYATQWAEINVGCESCHGPAAAHANWQPNNVNPTRPKPAYQQQLNSQQAQNCGSCHARRGPLLHSLEGVNTPADYALENIAPPLYHADGQIRDEVFVLGSFMQSKMHSAGVTCSDCHNPHSNQLIKPGNALCLNCHEASYNQPSHHRHAPYNLPVELSDNTLQYSGSHSNGQLLPENSQGNQCVDCHMPGKRYMGNDFRRDHSFRVPRPDLTASYPQLQLPNSCSSCHSDRDAAWAAEQIASWHGSERAAHFSETLVANAAGGERSLLQNLIAGNLESAPPIARATAVQLAAAAAPGSELERLLRQQLQDSEPLIRRSAVAALSHLDANYHLRVVAPMIGDPSPAVRLQVAQALSDISPTQLPATQQAEFTQLQRQYRSYLTANSDFPSLRYQAGVDAHRRGELDSAATSYQAALALDERFNPARYNLAQLRYQQGDRQAALQLYKMIVAQEPQAAAARHALGLLLGELGDNNAAIEQLLQAATISQSARSWYNAAILQQRSGRTGDAEKSYRAALAIAPNEHAYLTGLVSLLMQNNRTAEALAELDKAIGQSPYNRELRQLRYRLQNR